MLVKDKGRLSDEDVVKKVQSGRVDYFAYLINRYQPKLERYGRRFLFGHEDLEDLLQEVFLKTYLNIHSFKTDKRFSPWLYRIAHNQFINAIKKKGQEPVPFFDFDIIFPHPISKEAADKNALQKQDKQIMRRYLRKLEPKYREPIILYYFENMTYQEMAEILRVPVSTAGVRLKRAKEKLKTFYKNEQA